MFEQLARRIAAMGVSADTKEVIATLICDVIAMYHPRFSRGEFMRDCGVKEAA